MTPTIAPPDRQRICSLLEQFQNKQVLLVGDLAADHYIAGSTSRISREAPVLILKYDGEHIVPGQVGNTACNITSLGAHAKVVSAVGDDIRGTALRAALENSSIDCTGVVTVGGGHTITKSRLLAGGRHTCRQQMIRIDDDERLPIGCDQSAALVSELRSAAVEADVIIVSDYGYGVINDEVWTEVMAFKESLAKPVILDSRYSLARWKGATLITPNEEEAVSVAGLRTGRDPVDMKAVADRILEATAADNLIITRGNEGMAVFAKESSEPYLIPISGDDEVTDVTGAGDTVVATAALALASGATVYEAAHLANIAGGLVVMKMGTATVSRDEMAAAS